MVTPLLPLLVSGNDILTFVEVRSVAHGVYPLFPGVDTCSLLHYTDGGRVYQNSKSFSLNKTWSVPDISLVLTLSYPSKNPCHCISWTRESSWNFSSVCCRNNGVINPNGSYLISDKIVNKTGIGWEVPPLSTLLKTNLKKSFTGHQTTGLVWLDPADGGR